MKNLKGKVAIITGSSMGIGKALAFSMAKKGAKVVINGRDEDRLKDTCHMLQKEDFEVLAIQGDVSKLEDCKKIIELTVQSFGRIDILVNNAGLAAQGEVENTDPLLFKKVFEVNYLGCVYPSILAIPYIKESKGNIIFISSLAAIHGLPGHSIYSSSKMSLTAFAESLRIELNKTGVHIGIAYLGFIQNDPNKMIYQPNGELQKIPARKGVKIEPVHKIADKLIKVIEHRKHKTIFSNIGKILFFLNFFSPFIVEKILLKSYKKQFKG